MTASTNDGNVPANAVDNDLNTRWSGSGDGATMTLDLGSSRPIHYVTIAWYKGDTRVTSFDLQSAASATGPWSPVLTGGQSSGTSLAEETFNFTDTTARFLRYVGHGNNSTSPQWNSVAEISVFGQ